MATKERRRDRGTERGTVLIRTIGNEIRRARRTRGLSLARVGRSAQISGAALSRLERGLLPNVSVAILARTSELVGLELSMRTYPGPRALRDALYAALLAEFASRLHASLQFRTEVPFRTPGDRRSWDGTVSGGGWFYGVEAEMNPTDGQEIARRLAMRARDGQSDGVILLLPSTRQTRRFRRESGPLLAVNYPIDTRTALARLAAGLPPGGISMVVL